MASFHLPLIAFMLLYVSCDDEIRVSKNEQCRRVYAPATEATYDQNSGVFLIDTGCSRTHLIGPQNLLETPDPSWEITTVRVEGQNGQVSTKLIRGIKIGVFEKTPRITDVTFTSQQKPVRSTFWFDGILGVPEFCDIVMRINLRDSICEPVSQDENVADGTRVRFEPKSRLVGVPEIHVEFPASRVVPLMFDTGSSFFITLTKPQITHMSRFGLLRRASTIHGLSAAGLVPAETYILRSVTIAGYEFRDVLVCETAVDTIGLEFVDCFDTILDFPKREMWLKPLETEWPLRIPPDASGLILSYRDTDLLLVVRMEPDSAAIRSGLLEGDRVVLFDGKSPKDTSMRAMRKRLTEAGTTVKLKILREGKELDFDLPLSRSYEYPPKWPELNTDADDFFKSLQNEKKSAPE